jgi:LmbE family N-acetylglucosaminyl deacetylase/SAM-dependent methyltransferase
VGRAADVGRAANASRAADASRAANETVEASRPITAPDVWTAAIGRHRPPPFDVAGCGPVVVVAAHPDDETIGAGGLLQALHAGGVDLSLVVATDGEAAYPSLGPAQRRELARARRTELRDALEAQGLGGVPVRWLGLPDSGLAERVDELSDLLAPLLAGADAYLAPWPDDPHPDHRAAGLAAAAAAPPTSRGWSYPIWTWAWLTPDDPRIPWDRARAVQLDPAARDRRRRAVDCYTSQVGPGPDGSAAVLSAGLLVHVDRGVDLVFREPRSTSAPVSRFADLYAGGDPWGGDSWYERRKRSVVLAALPRERYGTVFEPGCGAGELSVELGTRADRVLASDPVAAAVERARGRALSRALPGVEFEVAGLPDAVPDEPVDLAVFSEVLYYLDDRTVLDAVDRTRRLLRPGGEVVLVHWRGWPAEAPRDAEATHRLVRGHGDWQHPVSHVDEQFLLDVLKLP